MFWIGDDGGGRAAETAIAAVLDRLGLIGDDADARAVIRAPILNTRGVEVGERRPSAVLLNADIEVLQN